VLGGDPSAFALLETFKNCAIMSKKKDGKRQRGVTSGSGWR
jgi:hypothetical protein